jgi:hypothetical protein
VHAIYDIGWTDRRLAFDPVHEDRNLLSFEEEKARKVLQSIWWPDLNFHNSYSKTEMENLALVIHSDGRVRIHKAIDANLKYKPDLSRLPFDYQILQIVIDAFGYSTHEIELTPDTDHTGYEENVMPAHWIVLSMSSKSDSTSVRHTDHSLSQLVFQLNIRRNWHYFFWRIFFPMTLIVAFSWSIFWLAPSDLAVRIELGIIFLLTIMAFSLGFGDYIPKISYLTFLG